MILLYIYLAIALIAFGLALACASILENWTVTRCLWVAFVLAVIWPYIVFRFISDSF